MDKSIKTAKKKKTSNVLFSLEGNAIVKAYSRQERDLKFVIENATKQLARIKKGKTRIFGNPTKSLTRKTIIEKFKKLKKEKKVYPSELLTEGLKLIGRPARVKEIADRLSSAHIAKFEDFTKNKKKLTQVLYNSASSLTQSGEIKRKPFDKKTFEYALAEWMVPNKANAKKEISNHRKMAA